MKCCNCKNLGKLIDENGVAYDWCEEIIDNPDIYDERLCHHFVVGNKADEIRRMTDEELAIYLQSICNCIECPTKRPCQAKTVGDCQKVWLDFLRKDLDFGEVMKEVKDYSPSKDPRLINCKTECGNERCLAKRYGLFAEKTCPNFVEPKPI